MQTIIEQLRAKAHACSNATKESRARKGAYIDCIVMLEEQVSDTDVNLEQYLLAQGFQMDTYNNSDKRFRKDITDHQNLYVYISANLNKILDVEYENIAVSAAFMDILVSLENITTFAQLQALLTALTCQTA